MLSNCSQLSFINILIFSSDSYFNIINLFDKYIPSSGTIITNENFKNKLNLTYLSGWTISSI